MENKFITENKNNILISLGVVVLVVIVVFLAKGRLAKAPAEEVLVQEITTEETVNPNRREFVITEVAVNAEDPHVAEAIKNAQAASVNFNEHYVVITVGCGTGCGKPYLFDKTTGKLFAFNQVILAGALGFEQVPEVIDFQVSPQTNVVTFRKKDTDGTEYFNQWRLYHDTLFVEVARR
jgi:hypothetical protein